MENQKFTQFRNINTQYIMRIRLRKRKKNVLNVYYRRVKNNRVPFEEYKNDLERFRGHSFWRVFNILKLSGIDVRIQFTGSVHDSVTRASNNNTDCVRAIICKIIVNA